MYLLDTVIISELRKKNADIHVVAWTSSVPHETAFLSAVSIFEIEIGVDRKRRANPTHAAALAEWASTISLSYGERILPMTAAIARRWARLADSIGHRQLDLAIAATALEHGLTVVTRNVRDFAPTGVATLNPFAPGASLPRGR